MSQNNGSLQQSPSHHARRSYQDYDDEISLIEVWLVFKKYKILVLMIVFLCLSVGVYIYYSSPTKYEYSTIIEIGNRVVNEKVRLLEEPATLRAKINESYIPLVQQDFSDDNPYKNKFYYLDASIPEKSEIIRVRGAGTIEEQSEYFKLLTEVTELVKKDHSRLSDVTYKRAEIEKKQLIAKKHEIDDRLDLNKARGERLRTKTNLIMQQIQDAEQRLNEMIAARQKALTAISSTADAIALSMVDSDIQKNHNYLNQLKEQLQVAIPLERDELGKQLADLKREKENIDEKIIEADLILQNLSKTRAVVPPMRSLEPINTGKLKILIFSFIIGIVLSIILPFVIEFIRKANQLTVKG